MDHEVDIEALAREGHRDRVDDERHVVGDDLDHRVRRVPAVLVALGVVDADLGLAGSAPAGEAPMRHRTAIEIPRVPIGQVLGRNQW